jgi:4-amino-4-deoxy-L-arabinose transferase-like glycosyltransferase
MSFALDPRARRRVLVLVMALAAVLRLAHLHVVMDTAMARYHVSFEKSDMHMFDQWAQHILASGDWLGRETYHPLYQWQLEAASEERWREWYGRAPVFYKAPFYAYALAAARRLWGDPMLPMALAQVFASVAGIAPLFALTERLFGAAAALAASLLFATYAPDIHYTAVLLRGPWIVLGALVVTWQLGRVLDSPTAGRGAGLGLATGLSLLVNEGFAGVLPLILAALLLRVRGARRLATLGAAFAAGLGLALAPLLARNALVGAPLLALAVTGSVVYAVFNAAGASPFFFFTAQPEVFAPIVAQAGGDLTATALGCLRSFSGPAAFVSFYAHKALGLLAPFENPDNANFYYAALRDPLLAWLPGYAWLLPACLVGLALAWRRGRELVVLLPVGLSLVAAMMLTLPLSRYRAVLAVLLMPAAGLALARAAAWARERRFAPLAGAVAAALLVAATTATAQARLVFAEMPPGHLLYRPAEFELEVRHDLARGRPAQAVRTLLELARLNPDAPTQVGALCRAAVLAGQHGELGGAHSLATKARARAAGDPVLLLAVGDTYGALGDPQAAARAWREALALTPGAALELEADLRRRLAGPHHPRPVE